MSKAVILAIKDLRILSRDRFGMFWVLGFPILFALFFGAVFSSGNKGPSGMRVAVVDEDKSDFSRLYVSHLQSYDALKITLLSREESINQVRTGKQVAAVILKKGFGDGFTAMFDNNDPKLQIASDPSRRMEGGYLQGLLSKAQFEALGERFIDRDWMRSQINDWRSEVAKDKGLNPKQTDVFLSFFNSFDEFIQDVNEKNYKTGLKGGIFNFAQLDVEKEKGKSPASSFQITFPQAIMWGLLGCAATFAISTVTERRTGTFNRLLIAPLSRRHILAGKALACLFTCMSVIFIQCLAARIFFGMPINSPILFVPAALCATFCFVGMMMFASTAGRTEQSVAGLTWVIFMIMAMLGGGMIPLIAMPRWLQSVSCISPVKWGIFALEGAIWRDLTAAEMVTPCAILLGVGLAAFSLGVLMLRKAEL
jgi:ABC-2 type transport system permease protein